MTCHLLHDFLGRDLDGAFPTLMHALTHPRVDAALASRVPALARDVFAKLSPAGGVEISPDAESCISAALYLLADDLDSAHALCQNVPTSLGSALHAHLHRREGDFSNSLYWWRRAGGLAWRLPAGALAPEVAGLLVDPHAAQWREELSRTEVYDPADLVAAVENLSSGAGPWSETLRAVQRLEWLSLFYACTR